MFKKFIDRPVLSTVISIVIVILGIIGIFNLPITQYPDIAPPTVRITATYPGANAETVLKSVVVPIEEQVNGVENMDYITSTSSNGRASINVYFKQGVDPDIAAVNVQNRVSRATPLLPQVVTQTGVVTAKQQTSSIMFMHAYTTDPSKYDVEDVQNYLEINVIPALQRINGIGNVRVFGANKYSMRIWIKPEKLQAYDLTPADIAAAINEQSREAAAGTLGQNSGKAFEYVITYDGRYKTVEQYKNIILKGFNNGEFLHLGDVADIELGSESYGVNSSIDGHPGVSMSIYQIAGSNARDIVNNVYKKMDQLEGDFPEGIEWGVDFDTNKFLNASIEKVIHTLIEAFILVFIVVFVFLQDFRSTLIPAIAVPVSIVGTFFFLNLFGFSLNLLTLFALVLAIGIVVDDAIVIVEGVHAKLDEGYDSAKMATRSAMSELTGAIISITLVMAAVFIPVTFLSGPTGVFYNQFGMTLMIAIIISAFNALTLSPALCAIILKPHKEDKNKNVLQRFYAGFNTAFSYTTHHYIRSVKGMLKRKWIAPLIVILSLVGILWLAGSTPTGFVPSEDRGIIFTDIQLPPGASLDRTTAINKKVMSQISQLKGVRGVSMVNGFGFLGGAGSNNAIAFVKLDDWSQRKADSLSVEALTKKCFGIAARFSGAQILFFSPPSVPGYGVSGGVSIELQDKSGGTFQSLDQEAKQFLMKLNARPELLYAQTSFSTEYPQYKINVDIPKAKAAGVSVSAIFSTLQGYIGSLYTNDFVRFGKQYRVYIQAPPNARADKKDFKNLYVRNSNGEMIPVSQFVTLSNQYGPQSVTRFNLYNSAKIDGAPAAGYSTGQALSAIQEVAANVLPSTFSIDYEGITREQVKAGNQAILILLLSVLFVYFILAAQYESYLVPLSVLLSLPLGIFGAYFGTKFFGLTANIYFQIALIMLLGLMAKNAILIVEFALQRRRSGHSLIGSALEGARVRLRPILMTSFAFILGILPLAAATGVGAIGNRSIGTSAASGLLIGTVFGVFVIPIFFVFFQWLQEKISGSPKTLVDPKKQAEKE